MSDDENEAVEQLAPAEQNIPEAPQADASQTDKDHNFRLMRQRYDELKRENEELKRRKADEHAVNREVDADEYSDDDIPTFGDVKKELSKIKKQYELDSVPLRYPDYYEVIKFVEPMIKDNPALVQAIENSPNPRETAYQFVKSSYAYNSAKGKNDTKKIEENLKKPLSSEAVFGGATADSSNRPMTLEEKAEVYRMAQQFARRAPTN